MPAPHAPSGRRRAPIALAAAILAGTAAVALGTALPVPAFAQGAQAGQADVAALDAFFERQFQQAIDLSPESQTQLGIKKDYGKWTDQSDAFAERVERLNRDALKELRATWKPDALPPTARVNYRLFEYAGELSSEAYKWRRHGYPLNHLYGRHNQVPAFLINFHRIETADDAKAYIARLNGIAGTLDQLIQNSRESAAKGIVAPKFSLQRMLPDLKSNVTGAPFEEGAAPSSLLADFEAKLAAAKIDDAQKKALTEEAKAALLNSVKPAYARLQAHTEELIAKATDDDGAWKLPDGDAYYRFTVKQSTTLDVSPEEVHQTGLRELARIHEDMRAILKKVGYAGTLQQFFEELRTSDRFYFPDTDEGRAAYLKQAEAYIDGMRPKLDGLFITKPKAPLVVKRVEAFREKSSPPAFYNRPSPDGSRPGTYYANLQRMRENPKYSLEAIVYHEAIPGHHMQIAIAQEMQGLPNFRKFGFFGAYAEGWGLYAERLPKELGFYQDPYSDFGRLNSEAWRAIRLVVDTGIHAKKWTRQQAIDYMVENAALARDMAVREVERYIVDPGQATSYYMGLIKILELRERAKKELGAKFDIRGFHEVVLTNGMVPLNILDELVTAWIAERKRTA
ncbi:MAG TPA: DUF885 domain-containing protein [Azospirillaceae bacterium]|nr:DUF885 domain-containing protein [Azospirillaceae bacterium]